jgi:hypothetical protein
MIATLAFAAGFLLMGGQFTLYGLTPPYYPAAVRSTGVGAAVAAGRVGSILGPLAAAELIGGGAAARRWSERWFRWWSWRARWRGLLTAFPLLGRVRA